MNPAAANQPSSGIIGGLGEDVIPAPSYTIEELSEAVIQSILERYGKHGVEGVRVRVMSTGWRGRVLVADLKLRHDGQTFEPLIEVGGGDRDFSALDVARQRCMQAFDREMLTLLGWMQGVECEGGEGGYSPPW